MTVLLVVFTFAVFLGIGWLLQRRKAMAPAAAVATAAAGGVPVRLPRGIFFARSHTWLNLFPSGRAWLGVDDFVTQMLERPRVRFLKQAGERVARGEPLLRLEDGDHGLTVRSPLAGRLLAVNTRLTEKPELLRRAPFADGWAVEVRPDHYADVKAMPLGDESRGWIRDELARLRDLLAGAGAEVSPAMLQDGGPPIAGALRHAGAEVWSRFEREFLEVR